MTPAITRSITRRSARTTAALALCAAAMLALGGCATGAPDSEKDAAQNAADGGKTVTIAVHDSFPNEEFEKAASEATGYTVKVVSAGDGGELTNKLVLTKGAPIADAFFGVDTIFASRLIENGVAAKYAPEHLAKSAEAHRVEGDESLTPVDLGATCINVDTGWFANKKLAEPKSYEDLAKPEYKDLTVLLDPTASSTGASFLVGTVSKFGENGFAGYWKSLVDNGARVEQGWTDAYNGQFTQGGGEGTRPIVVSYSSSPAFTVSKDGKSTTTKALLDTCSKQVEYAGVLTGAKNEAGAKAVVDYLVSREFQDTIPDAMYMYPADAEAKVPAAWSEFAPLPSAEQSHDLPAAEIERGREGWLKTLSEKIGL
ncbi:thiamine ABC transporter substrate-binding protein [Leucobacter sp. CSA2]|uniref:Thiamine ABC transporter substrate-binding protein n=1 Tax=Leucobacter edaphi TaxID=2796472 RepID=A0A934UWP3_9MICO|nr:thiamine ABC transporter substrate-binding protein [Leucobacter edaphi]MBK0420741.1 thiamine ABC transporter substrate-binding protein [Leucobacter edaphi]